MDSTTVSLENPFIWKSSSVNSLSFTPNLSSFVSSWIVNSFSDCFAVKVSCKSNASSSSKKNSSVSLILVELSRTITSSWAPDCKSIVPNDLRTNLKKSGSPENADMDIASVSSDNVIGSDIGVAILTLPNTANPAGCTAFFNSLRYSFVPAPVWTSYENCW